MRQPSPPAHDLVLHYRNVRGGPTEGGRSQAEEQGRFDKRRRAGLYRQDSLQAPLRKSVSAMSALRSARLIAARSFSHLRSVFHEERCFAW